MLNYKIDFAKLDWEFPLDGVRCKKLQQNNKQIRLVEYSKTMPPHWCSKGHYGIILEGEFEIEFDNQKLLYKTGDGVYIPDGEEHRHKAKVISDKVKVLFVEEI